MKTIYLDGDELHFGAEDLPVLIHGADSSGASLYTITLAADLYASGTGFLFLCGYPMAEQEFTRQVGAPDARAAFYTQEHVAEFQERAAAGDRIVIVKN